MDSLIKRFDGSLDRDLMVCSARGVAYQHDMRKGRVDYGDQYFAKVSSYEGSDVAKKVNEGRCSMLLRHLANRTFRVLDIGAGSGAFVRAARDAGFEAMGFEVIPAAAQRLKKKSLFSPIDQSFAAYCMWDSIEHMEDPELSLNPIPKGAHLFVSLPVFKDLADIRSSKHYRPGEHLYYWTEAGFIEWMSMRGFTHLESSTHETDAGRESIGAFAFRKSEPDYHDYIALYSEMHASRFYGSSATELHLETIASIVRAVKPSSILDYGCGRSDLSSHFWLDGQREIARYDPAIPAFKTLPGRRYDLVLCCDVMEHIPASSVERVLREVRTMSKRAVFTISTKLARARLPNGRNAHATLLTRGEWGRWIADLWGVAKEIPSAWDHELIIAAGDLPGVEGKRVR